jgi:hypothetical protein
MKKIILILILILLSRVMTAQETKSAYDSVKYAYCELMNYNKPMSIKMTIGLAIPEKSPFREDAQYKDSATGKWLTFTTVIDGLEYMGARGWRLVYSYTSSIGGIIIISYVLEKRR